MPLLPPGACCNAGWLLTPCPALTPLSLPSARSAGLPDDLELHHIIVNDWERGVDAEQNVVLVSIASVKEPGMAPPGKHCLHAYLPATEPYELWQGLDTKRRVAGVHACACMRHCTSVQPCAATCCLRAEAAAMPCRPRSPEYAELKEQRSQVLWRGLEKIIPDIRQRAEVRLRLVCQRERAARMLPCLL